MPAEPRPDTDRANVSSAHDGGFETVAAPPGVPMPLGFGPPVAPGEVGTLGPYRVVKELGKGGMGAVYAALDTRLERPLALKVMLPESAADAEAKERFLREARAAARIKHANVVTVYEADARDGVPYIAMEFLDGLPLDAYLKKKGSPAIRQVVRIAAEAAAGLAAAHAIGLVHRDVKPANLWLEAPDGHVKVLDFGLARPVDSESELTKSGAVVGTPAFMSPEQARGEKVDHRTDLFSLGAVLYRLCTGRNPFPGATVMAVLVALATEDPPPVRNLNPDVPQSLAQLIHQLLSKRAADRPQSAAEVVERLQAVADGSAVRPASQPRTAPQVVCVPLSVTTATAASPFADLDSVDDERTEHDPDGDSPVRAKPGPPWLWPAVGLVALLTVAGVVVAVRGVGGPTPTAVTPNATTVPGTDVPRGPVAPATKPTDADPDRTAALWVIRQGGFVRVNGEPESIPTAPLLPKNRFALTVVGLTEMKVADAEVSNLKGLKELTYLVLWNTGVSDAALEHLTDLPELSVLDLYGTKVTGAGLKHLGKLNGLTHLDLGGTQVTDAGLEPLAELKSLTYLSLSGTQVTDTVLTHLKALPRLKRIDLGGTKLTAKGRAEIVAALPGCSLAPLDPDREAACYALSLGGKVRVSGRDRELASAGELPKESFALTRADLRDRPVADAGLERFRELKGLTDLYLQRTKVSEKGLKHLAGLHGLALLDVGNTPVGDSGLEHLGKLKGLSELSLHATAVTDEGLPHLSELKGLRGLHLSDTAVSDAGLAEVKRFKSLTRLWLFDTAVSDAGLEHLKELKALTLLDLRATKVTAKGIGALHTALPGCKIEHDGVIEPKK